MKRRATTNRARKRRTTNGNKVAGPRKADKLPDQQKARKAKTQETERPQDQATPKPSVAKVTPLRKRMAEDLKLAGFAERTQECYVRAVRQLAEHYGRSPDTLSDQQIRDYFLYLKDAKKFARGSMSIAFSGIRFVYDKTCPKNLPSLKRIRVRHEKAIPVVLSREEVAKILSGVRLLRYRAVLTTIYSCGLRIQEGTHLQVGDIHSDRMVIHVHRGKGAKDRYVPLPATTPLTAIRARGHGDVTGRHSEPVRSRVRSAERRTRSAEPSQGHPGYHPLSYSRHAGRRSLSLR